MCLIMKHIGNLLLGWMMLGDVRRKLDPHFFSSIPALYYHALFYNDGRISGYHSQNFIASWHSGF